VLSPLIYNGFMELDFMNLLFVLFFILIVLVIATLVWKIGQELRAQKPRFDGLEKSLDSAMKSVDKNFSRNREDSINTNSMLRIEILNSQKNSTDSLVNTVAKITESQKEQLEGFSVRLKRLEETTDKRFFSLQESVENKLGEIRTDNEKKLESMRKTVEEKLQGTLETRLGESFKLVSQQLDMVSKGLGEMKHLASGVGDLKKVLTNVKTRGTWGEIAAGNILEQILTPGQFEKNVEIKKGSGERVDYAVKMPGPNREMEEDEVVWLPIDAKFPKEDYERLVDASDMGDREAVAKAGDSLERQVKINAKSISEKYIRPPRTTDFGIMFLPSEAIYAEILRRPGLADGIQGKFRIVIAGPSTLAALLNSLQMGFQTLAIQKRSSEVWKVLGGVKVEFGKFGEVLSSIRTRLDQATKTIDKAEVRSRAINRQLRDVKELAEGKDVSPLDRPGIPGEEL
jgi:DNA recombination protein RmuC